MEETNFPFFDSITFNRIIYSNELQDHTTEELYLLRDELTVVLEDLSAIFKQIPRVEKPLSPIKDEIRNLKIFEVTLKRIIYYKNKSEVEGLRKCKEAWKKRALLLGSELGLTKNEIKQLVEIELNA
jgi:hypothetical protein